MIPAENKKRKVQHDLKMIPAANIHLNILVLSGIFHLVDRVKSSEICLVWKTESSCSRCKDDIIKHFLHVNNLQKVFNN
jgi:hypothetical protein